MRLEYYSRIILKRSGDADGGALARHSIGISEVRIPNIHRLIGLRAAEVYSNFSKSFSRSLFLLASFDRQDRLDANPVHLSDVRDAPKVCHSPRLGAPNIFKFI